MKKGLFYSLILFLTVWVTGLPAQKVLPVRIEVPGDLEAETYRVEPVGSRGVIIFYQSKKINEEGKRIWYFGLFNTKLQQVWLKKVALGTDLAYLSSRHNGDKLYFLFKSSSRRGRDYDVYQIVVYDNNEQHFKSITGSIPYKSEIASFNVLDNTACIGLTLQHRKADMAFVDLTTGEIKPYHLNSEEEALIETVYSDRKNKRFIAVVKYYNPVTFFKDEVLLMNSNGTVAAKMNVDYPDNIRLPRNFRVAQSGKNRLIMLGTYDLITGKKPDWKDLVLDKQDTDVKSAGFFFLSFSEDKQDKLTYYDFLKFDNTFYSVHGKEIQVTKSGEKTLRMDKNNNQKVNVFYHVNNPKVTKLDDEFVFSVELYKPYYKTETRMDYDFYGRPYPYTYQVFAGYEFYDVIFSGFDKNGNMQWNNDFAINNLLTYSLDDHVVVVPDPPLLTLAYVNNGQIIAETFQGAKDISGRLKLPLESVFAKDKVIKDENNRIRHWYDDYFLVYGYQKIRNRSLKDKANRTVFFMNKVAFK